jgi:uncharacterized protein (DUF1499 family)
MNNWQMSALIILAALLIAVIAFFILGVRSSDGSSGAIGVKEGKLAECRSLRNCFSSNHSMLSNQQAAEPWTYRTTRAEALAKLAQIMKSTKGYKIIAQDDSYLYAEFTSNLFRFVDDVELYLSADSNVIQYRSASRVGGGDLWANRKRIEQLKRDFEN